MASSISFLRLVLREMQRSKMNTLLSLIVVMLATGVWVAMLAVGQASEDVTRKMMKDMGFNLMITPKGTDPARLQILDFSQEDMPEEYVTRLAAQGNLPAEHFVGKLQKRIEIRGETAVLTGVMAEAGRTGSKVKPMPTAYEVKPGEVYLASAIAQRLRMQPGASLNIEGRSFSVAKVLEPVGAMPEDIRIFAELHEVQVLLNRAGRINAIDALSCQCDVPIGELMAFLEKKIREVLPDVEVTAYKSILLARHQQRSMVHLMGLITLSLVMTAAAVAIWGLTYQNVHNRRYEIGVFRALGVPGWKIVSLFLGKITLYSVCGAALGCVAGWRAAQALNLLEGAMSLPSWTYTAALLATPAAAALLGLPPILSRLAGDPTEVLGDRGT